MTGHVPPTGPLPGAHLFKNRNQAPGGNPRSAPPKHAPPPPATRPGPQPTSGKAAPEGARQPRAVPTPLPGHEFFVNPYNFVPLHTNRDSTQDRPPAPQGVWHDGLFSGHLTVQMTTQTPLLPVRRTRLATPDSPALLTVKTAPDGTPAVNGSSVKGMLRSLFEQATGSRLGVFNHDSRLSYRRSAEGAQHLKLAKVVRSDSELELLVAEGLRPEHGATAAPVWVEHGLVTKAPFGTEVFMWLTLHERNGRTAWFPSTLAGTQARADVPSRLSAPSGWQEAGAVRLLVRARLHNTGHTIGGKRFERVFVEEVIKADGFIPRLDDLVVTRTRKVGGTAWSALRDDWQAQIDSMSGEAGTDSQGNKLALAPYGGEKDARSRWKQLVPGQTLFVEMDRGTISGIYPGMITRQMHRHSPRKLVPPPFLPAEAATEMSPADRVFGWVASKTATGPSAYRGLLAVGGVWCITPDPIATFPAVRLAVLEKPKESQFRFYTRTRTQDPTQQPGALDGVPVSEGFDPRSHVIAGHKVYPHHGVPEAWWRTPTEPWQPSDEADSGPKHPTAKGQPLSYLAANGTKKQVSAELDSWVKPGVTFETRLRLTNLTADELGALLWILRLEGHHRLGLGKPLGFGSLAVRIDWSTSAIRNRDQLVDRYRSVGEGGVMSHEDLEELRTQFDEHFRSTQPAVYMAMLESARGFSGETPVHYPRVRPARPQAETFHWFVTNERGARDQDRHGPRHALPPLGRGGDPALPILAKRRDQGS